MLVHHQARLRQAMFPTACFAGALRALTCSHGGPLRQDPGKVGVVLLQHHAQWRSLPSASITRLQPQARKGANTPAHACDGKCSETAQLCASAPVLGDPPCGGRRLTLSHGARACSAAERRKKSASPAARRLNTPRHTRF